jgi:hypothetical protein
MIRSDVENALAESDAVMFRISRQSAFAATMAGAVLAVAAVPAGAAEPASGADITGKTVYVAPGARLRYGKSLLSGVYSRTNAYLQLTGNGVCTAFNCPVKHNNVELLARRSQVDDAKPANGTVVTERTLRNGDEGDDVKVMQDVLIKKGYTVKADGKFGRDTERAVSDFQKKSGIDPDGEIGAKTREKLTV